VSPRTRRAFVVGGGGAVAPAGTSVVLGGQVDPHTLRLQLGGAARNDVFSATQQLPGVVDVLGAHLG
jgi:hypothetical protein